MSPVWLVSLLSFLICQEPFEILLSFFSKTVNHCPPRSVVYNERTNYCL